MVIYAACSDDKGSLLVSVVGAFDFSVRDDLLSVLEHSSKKNIGCKYVLDMSSVTSIDNTGLDLLLMFCRLVKLEFGSVEVINSNGVVKEAISALSFYSLFSIS